MLSEGRHENKELLCQKQKFNNSPISLPPDGVNPSYFKLRLFDLTEIS